MATSRTGARRRRRGSGTAMGVGDELDVRVVPCSFDGDQAGSYLGALEANRTLHAIYALDNGTVTLDNLFNTGQSGLSVESKVYNLAGTVLDDEKASNTTLASQQVLTNVLTPKVPAVTVPPTPASVYFVELLLRNSAGTIVGRNVYWLSTQQDVVDWSKTLGVPQATLSQCADLTGLQTLPAIPHPATSATSVTTTQSCAARPAGGRKAMGGVGAAGFSLPLRGCPLCSWAVPSRRLPSPMRRCPRTSTPRTTSPTSPPALRASPPRRRPRGPGTSRWRSCWPPRRARAASTGTATPAAELLQLRYRLALGDRRRRDPDVRRLQRRQERHRDRRLVHQCQPDRRRLRVGDHHAGRHQAGHGRRVKLAEQHGGHGPAQQGGRPDRGVGRAERHSAAGPVHPAGRAVWSRPERRGRAAERGRQRRHGQLGQHHGLRLLHPQRRRRADGPGGDQRGHQHPNPVADHLPEPDLDADLDRGRDDDAARHRRLPQEDRGHLPHRRPDRAHLRPAERHELPVDLGNPA